VAYYNTDQPTVTVSIRLTGSAGGWSDRIDMIKDVTLTKGKITRLTIAFDENSDCWLLTGTLPEDTFGTVPIALIKSNGDVMAIYMPGY
jgi:hypothetical protein